MGSSFRDLVAWQRSIDLSIAVYALTLNFPESEKFGLSSQMRRAAVSVASNVAEGYGRSSTGEYLQFLGHARGSNSELETQLVIAKALSFGRESEIERTQKICDECGRLIGAIMRAVRAKSPRP